MQPGGFTELFFLDEATAFAAGHRPCALCRREDYVRLVALWRELHPGQATADAIDVQLHSERVDPTTRAQLQREASPDDLPDGAFIVHQGEPHLVLGGQLLRWTTGGYTTRARRPSGRAVRVITPPSLLWVLSAAWHPQVPLLHHTASSQSVRETALLTARSAPPRSGPLEG
jgi:hypothetical protein